ncbi:MAG: FAD-linked oxidase C-terminal domain-containing protein, partial [Clostridiales bacterium]
GRTVKNVTGYDLTSLLTGSEGTLAIITEITLSLLPKPSNYRTALVGFDKLDNACQTVADLVANGVIPATLELMDNYTIVCVENAHHFGLPVDMDAILLIEVDGNERQVDEDIAQVEEVCQKNHSSMIRIAQNEEERENLWAARRAVAGAVLQLGPTKISEDATVPRSQIPEMVRRLKEISQRYQLHMPIYGHAGDGNLHPNIVTDKTNAEEMKKVHAAIEEIFKAALDLGGTLSGEHGIGSMKKPFMTWEMGEEGVKYLQAIKKAVDPNNILNPGKVI